MKKNGIIMFIWLFLFCASVLAQDKVKYPNVSGQFYSSDKNYLSIQIDNFFKNVKDDPSLKEKDIKALIVPHAGYIYSGQVASFAFKAIKEKKFDAVIILAPSHFYAFRGVSVYKEGLFRTPLGDIQVDSPLAQKLISYDEKIDFIPQAFEKEHSLEVELPFLQKSLENLKIVPVILGQIDYSDAVMVAKAIREITKDKKVLIVASTDLSHYHQYSQAIQMDTKTISYINNLDSFGLWQSEIKSQTELCGLFPVLVLLNYAKELGLSTDVLNYANSGDVTGDKSAVVGYSSIIFFKQSNDSNSDDLSVKGEEEMFNDVGKRRLLEIARQTITEYITNGKAPDFKEDNPQLNIKRGAFVTLHKEGDLRGCIGTFTSNEPIYKTISKMAIESATEDQRFRPVTREELDKIKLEISVLTEPKLINDWRKIKLGIDGVIIKRGFNQGVFLPQVATETGWDLETFLSQLCWQKAGLPQDCYKDPSTQIYTFQAIIFSED